MEEFKKNGVTHIVTIPDSETNYLYELMLEQDWLDVVPVSREGETMGVALGLNVAGKVPVCLIQNTGMMESGDSIRGMALDAGLPAADGDWVSRLDALGQDARHGGDLHRAVPERLPHQLLSREHDEDGARISEAFAEAQRTKRPVVVLVGDEYHGFNR